MRIYFDSFLLILLLLLIKIIVADQQLETKNHNNKSSNGHKRVHQTTTTTTNNFTLRDQSTSTPIELETQQQSNNLIPTNQTIITSLTTTTTTTKKTTTTTTTNSGAIETTIDNSKIIDMLIKIQISGCKSGPNPKLDTICPVWQQEVKKRAKNNEDLNTKLLAFKFSDIVDTIIDSRTLNELNEECKLGEWCIDHDLSVSVSSNFSIKGSLKILGIQSQVLCMLANCYKYIDDYAQNCVGSSYTRNIFSLVPTLCKISKTTTPQSEQCVEKSMRLVHLAYAAYLRGGVAVGDDKSTEASSSSSFNLTETCEFELNEHKSCPNECKTFAYEINKLESCCDNTDIVKALNAFNWYFLSHKTRDYCELPIKSFCISDGKYYVDVSVKLLVITLVSFVVLLLLLTWLFYLMCCHSVYKSNSNSNNLYDYSRLDQNLYDEEQMERSAAAAEESHHQNLASKFMQRDLDEDFDLTNKNDENNNNYDSIQLGDRFRYLDGQKMSKFVNQQQSYL